MKTMTFTATVIVSLLQTISGKNSNENKAQLKDLANLQEEDISKSTEFDELSTELQRDSVDEPSGGTSYFMIAVVIVIWGLFIAVILTAAYSFPQTESTKATQLWEFAVFPHMYLNVAALMAIFIPQNIESADGVKSLGNGGLCGGINLLLSAVVSVTYSKVIKVSYGNNPKKSICSAMRVIYLGVAIATGFITGAIIIYVASYTTSQGGTNWIYAFNVIVAIYIVVAVPAIVIALWWFDANRYPVGHVRLIAQGFKSKSRPLQQTASELSTGSTYYENVMKSGRHSKVKSISMYGRSELDVQGSPGGQTIASPRTAKEAPIIAKLALRSAKEPPRTVKVPPKMAKAPDRISTGPLKSGKTPAKTIAPPLKVDKTPPRTITALLKSGKTPARAIAPPLKVDKTPPRTIRAPLKAGKIPPRNVTAPVKGGKTGAQQRGQRHIINIRK